MTREKMLKRFRDLIENLSEIIPLRHEVFEALCDEFDDALCDRDYRKLDDVEVEYITGA